MQISGVQSLCNSLLSSPLCCEHPAPDPPQTFGSIPSPPGVTLLHLRNCQGGMLGQYPIYFSSLRGHYFLLPGALCLGSHGFTYFVHSSADSGGRTYLIPVIPCWLQAEPSDHSYTITNVFGLKYATNYWHVWV